MEHPACKPANQLGGSKMSKQAAVTDRDHGKDNAAAWASNLAQMVAALECDYEQLGRLQRQDAGELTEDETQELRELTAAATIDGDTMADAEEARERIQESPLSVQVRSGWASVGEALNAEEFEILLTAGGPALRIRGELDENREPSRAWLEYQDWGTGWTQYFDVEKSTLLTFCGVFYFGEKSPPLTGGSNVRPAHTAASR